MCMGHLNIQIMMASTWSDPLDQRCTPTVWLVSSSMLTLFLPPHSKDVQNLNMILLRSSARESSPAEKILQNLTHHHQCKGMVHLRMSQEHRNLAFLQLQLDQPPLQDLLLPLQDLQLFMSIRVNNCTLFLSQTHSKSWETASAWQLFLWTRLFLLYLWHLWLHNQQAQLLQRSC